MQADAILVLHHAYGNLEQLQDHGCRLSVGQLGMDQGLGAQGVMQDVGGAGEEQAHVIGQKGVVGGAVAGQVILDHLDEVFVLTASTVQIAVEAFGAGQIQGGDHEAGILAQRHDLGLEHDAEGLRPGAGGVVDVMIGAGARRQGLVEAAGILAAQFMLYAVVLQEWLCQARKHLVAGQPEDEIGVRVRERQLHQLRIGEMPVAAQHDVRIGPGRAQVLEHPLEDHGVFRPFRSFAGTQRRGDELARNALEEEQRQIAMAAVMMVVEAQLLLPVGGVLGVIHVQDEERGRCGIAGDELIDKRLGQAVDILGRCGILQTREGGGAGQIAVGVQGLVIHPQLEHRVGSQGIGVIAVLIPAGDLKDTLGKKIAQRVLGLGGMALVVEHVSETPGQADLAINTTQDHGAEVRGHRTAVEISADCEASDGRKTQLLWSRLGHGRPRLASSEALLA